MSSVAFQPAFVLPPFSHQCPTLHIEGFCRCQLSVPRSVEYFPLFYEPKGMCVPRLHISCPGSPRSGCPCVPRACPGSGAISKPCWADAPKPAAHVRAKSVTGVGNHPRSTSMPRALAMLSSTLLGLSPIPTPFPMAPWGSSLARFAPQPPHAPKGYIYNADIQLDQENGPVFARCS